MGRLSGFMLGILLSAASGAAAQTTADDAMRAADADLAPVGTVDPNAALANPPAAAPAPAAPAATPTTAAPAPAPAAPSAASAPAASTAPAASSTTYAQKDVVSAAENVFGRGAEGLATMIENIFKDQGEPNAYIVGREAGGAIGIGLRYGSGTLFHKVEGEQPVYWTGPSVGFDLGADASKTFALVYNLFDSEDLYRRYPAVEGKVYLVGGFTANYLQRGDVIVVPIKLGVGWRLGANIGYMSFSKKSKILPF